MTKHTSIVPRGLNRLQSATYVGVGVTKFDQLVADGRMPPPRRIDARRVWDRTELDDGFEALPHADDKSDEGDNPWDSVAA